MALSAKGQPTDLYLLVVALAAASLLTYFRVISEGHFAVIGALLVVIVILFPILEHRESA